MIISIRELKKNRIFLFLMALVPALALVMPYSIYGQDGYYLWFPIVSEYLKGDKVFHSSAVIFNGQNLSAIYGELPFWKLFRLLDLSQVQFLNLTHAIFVLLLFYLFMVICKGMKRTMSDFDRLACFLFASFSPVVLNRVWAGHFNLLYGMLPFFAAVGLIFDKSKRNLAVSLMALWFAFSIQSYQILAYHIFYLPLLLILVHQFEPNKRQYLLFLSAAAFSAFLINLPQFLEMYEHAISPDNQRNLNTSFVYSYIVTVPFELLHLLITSPGPDLSVRPYGFFHEINYGSGAFLILLGISKVPRKIKITVWATAITLFLFCMNLPVFNLLAELPIIKAFRVPQRALMLLSMAVPLLTYSFYEIRWERRDGVLLSGIALASILVPSFEVLLILAVLILVALQSSHTKGVVDWSKYMILLALCSLLPGMKDKILSGQQYNEQYDAAIRQLKPLKEKFSAQQLRQNTFHFETQNPMLANYTAQSLGIRTMEGYGHPPLKLLSLLEKAGGVGFTPGTNQLYFPNSSPMKERILDVFSVDYIITIPAEGAAVIIKRAGPAKG